MKNALNRIHFIAIGGSVMHSLALALHQAGYLVSGSDDHIHEPAYSRLSNAGILPAESGWSPDRIHEELDGVILGMHAKSDNPELAAAKRLNIPVYSFPGFLGNILNEKQQVVVAGSHGKTTITSMIMHILKSNDWIFDHVVGAQVPGFSNPVQVETEGNLAVLEGDEYPASCLERKPKFLFYNPAILVLSGISWDHINVFPSFDSYLEAFETLLKQLPDNTPVIYDAEDPYLPAMLKGFDYLDLIPYYQPSWTMNNHQLIVQNNGVSYPMPFAGTHNLKNLASACLVAQRLGIPYERSLNVMQAFEGAEKRLQKLFSNDQTTVFRDFAHAPSKVKATISGIKAQYPDFKLIAVLELHTFSSLNRNFLQHYKGTLSNADEALVFINPDAMAEKGSDGITEEEVESAFGFNNGEFKICFNADSLQQSFLTRDFNNANVILMSSGTFSNTDLASLLQAQLEG
jgi:UDP-N-acetylmuramate: L-alanyl-gamma-D-glutamyl-meso-diaminopimelate ligase